MTDLPDIPSTEDPFGFARTVAFNSRLAAKLQEAGNEISALLHTPISVDIHTATALGAPEERLLLLGLRLIDEEVAELRDALLIARDPVEVLKEAADVQVVLSRLIYLLGLAPVFPEAFKRVMDNSELKLTNGTIRKDGKLVKAPSHPKPDLKDLV